MMEPAGSRNGKPRNEAVSPDTVQAEFRLPTKNLGEDISFFSKELGFRLDTIYPADDPVAATMSGHGVRIRLERGANDAPGTIRLLCRNPAAFAGGRTDFTAPNGTRIEIADATPRLEIPQTDHSFIVHRLQDGASWIVGRAGMLYRDLIPGRLGGSIIASHIRIPDGGPVPDMVHYHTVRFQLIFCYRGWVKLVYENQGPPFVLRAGDCVIQPPEIRHRVLEASKNLEVVEIAVPAEHVTTIDHDMTLPTPALNPDREYGGQKFHRHKITEAVWCPWRIAGFEARDTGISEATKGLAGVQIARRLDAGAGEATSHTADILFTFVLAGTMTLQGQGRDPHDLSAGDVFAIPPNTPTVYANCSGDLELLEVTLPGSVETIMHEKL